MLSDSEILLAINNVLSEYTTEVDSATSKSTWIKVLTDDRVKASEDIKTKLKQLNVKFRDEKTSKSSFSAIVFDLSTTKDYIFFKNPKGGGSGAGAALTKLSESSQALYAALAFYVIGGKIDAGDVTVENLEKASKWIDTDEKVENMINDLPEDWIKSCTIGANKLYENFKNGKSYKFHRGSKTVNQIEKHAWSVIKSEGAFGNLNKWSPADIYIISDDFDINSILVEKTLRGLNNSMYNNIKEEKLIGISLKKITSNAAKISKKNFPTNKKEVIIHYNGFTSTFDSMDAYLLFNGGKVQFRSFGGDVSLSGWQGEVKGASANQGKISLGPLNFILKRHGVKELPTSESSAKLAVSNTEAHAKEIEKMMLDLKVIKSSKNNLILIRNNSKKWRYSKYLCLKLINLMESLNKEKANEVMEDIYLYASSQATYSAPYMKLE